MTLRLATLLVLATAPAVQGGELRGRVLAENKPLVGVTVAALPLETPEAEARREALRQEEPKPIVTATTKPDGTFTIALPATAGVVRLRVSGGGAAPFWLGRVLDAAEGDDIGDVPVAKAATLAGRVVDGRGGPVVAATVTLRAGGRGFEEGIGAPVTTTTAADGSFKFSEAGDAGNQLRIEAPAFATTEMRSVRAGAMAKPVPLAPGRTISGSVMLPDRRTPAAGALVRFEGKSTTRWVEARRDGTFLVDGVPAEAGSLVADGGEKGRASAPAPDAGAKATLVLAPTAGVRGRVVDASSAAPVAGIRVVARCRAATFTGRSGSDGRYEVRGLLPGVCRLSADDARYVPWAGRATLSAGETEAQDFPLVRAATLAGRVVDPDGHPLEGATGLVLGGRESPFRAFMRFGATPTFRSGPDGTFKAARLAPGTNVRLTVRHEDFEPRTLGGITLVGGTTKSGVSIVLSRGLSVRGLVKDEDDRPVPGADVELLRSRMFQGGRRGDVAQMAFVGGPGQSPKKTTGADGRFEFRGLSAGDYTLVASKKGMTHERVDPLKVAEGGQAEPVQVVLRPGSAITGTVRDKSGTGVAGWIVVARPQSAGGGPMAGLLGQGPPERTSPDGSFLLEGLTAGEIYEVQALSESGPGPRKSGVVAPADVEIVVSGKGRIRGTVVDADSGKPVPDFEVGYETSGVGGMRMRFRAADGRSAPGDPLAVHADDGAFVLEEVPAGKWDVQASASGYQKGRASGVTVDEGGSTDGVEVRLAHGGTITGRVVEDRTGRPIIDASVRAEPASGGGRELRMMVLDEDGPATTDAEGRFRLEGLPPGSYTLTATHPEWTEETERVELKEQAATIDIRLGRGGAIGGAVVAGGRGVAGASVSLSAAGGSSRGPFGGGGLRTAVTDDAGRFRFDTLTAGRYTLLATLRSQTSPPAEAVLQGEASQEVTLVLGEGATIRGAVTGLAENARGNVMVSANGPDEYFANTRTGGDGTFELTGAPKGPINLRANAGDFGGSMRSAAAQVVIAEGQTEAAVDIVFESGFRVDGQVTRGGRAVTDAMVAAVPEGGPGRMSSARTDDSGSFVLEGLLEGTYTFMANSMGGGAPIRKTAKVVGDMTVDLEAPPAKIAGQVVEADSGRPLGEAVVRVEQGGPGGGGGGGGPLAMMASESDSSGRFLIENLEPRSYRVSVTRPSYQTETRDIAAAEDSDVTIPLKRGEGVGLVVRDGIFATPLRGVFVRVVDAGGMSAFMGGVTLDSDGRGDIPSLKPGQYEVRLGADSYASLALRGISVPSPPLSVALTPGGTVDIQSGPQTLALPNPSARLLDSAGAPYYTSPFSTDGVIRLGANPFRRLEHVAPGRYTFVLDNGVRRDLDVREGGSSVVVLP